MKRAPKRSTKPAPLSRSTSRRLADERDQLAAQVEELHEQMDKRVDAALDARDIAIARLYAIDELLREGASKVARGEAEWTSELERVRELIAAYADAKQGYDAFRQIAAKAQERAAELADRLIVTGAKLASLDQELRDDHHDLDEVLRERDEIRAELAARDAELAEARAMISSQQDHAIETGLLWTQVLADEKAAEKGALERTEELLDLANQSAVDHYDSYARLWWQSFAGVWEAISSYKSCFAGLMDQLRCAREAETELTALRDRCAKLAAALDKLICIYEGEQDPVEARPAWITEAIGALSAEVGK